MSPAFQRHRRVAIVAGAAAAGLIIVGAPVTAFALTGTFSSTPAVASGNHEGAPHWAISKTVLKSAAVKADSVKAAAAGLPTYAYVAAAGGYEIVKIDVATDTIVSAPISDDTGEGLAVSPAGSTVYVANTGQYSVLAANPTTGAATTIEVGAYPQDVALSPDGSLLYAAVTGGDTGPGGSNAVAVINTATNAVVGDVRVGTGPRQVVFSPNGTLAYVSTETGIYVINTATSRVVRVIGDRDDPQGIAISPDGSTLYVTNPDAGTLWQLDAATGRVIGVVDAGAEPYSVAVAPNGSTIYVADMNSNSVDVISAATGRVTGSIAVQGLPMSIAVTPDGSQVWVGNGYTGSVSVISAATNKVTTTISGGGQATALNSAITAIAFSPAS
jgi:YVTN family beta-propeller protein